MRNSNELLQNTGFHIIAWSSAALVGLVAILGAVILDQTAGPTATVPPSKLIRILSGFLNGVGIACVTAAVFQILTRVYSRLLDAHWHKNHIEIFAEKRTLAGPKYAQENDDIHEKLRLMGFSLRAAIRDLAPGNRLHRAFIERGADVQLLIADPSSPGAEQQALADSHDRPDEAMEEICSSFGELSSLYEKYKNDTAAQKCVGTLAVRLMAESPSVTLHIRDDEAVIFGHYFPRSRGDDFAAFKIMREWNSKVFDQYKELFDGKWAQANQREIMQIGRGSCFFNAADFENTISICRGKVQTLKQGNGRPDSTKLDGGREVGTHSL